MTTKVTVSANHGWPVDVTTIPDTEGGTSTCIRVPAGETRDFYVWKGQDLRIHEVQPDEIATEAVAEDAA